MDSKSRKLAKRRKFLREIGSIVLGVLIALALGAVATQIGWKIDVRNANSALAEELGEIIGQSGDRVHIYPCAESKLAAIGTILDQADRTGRLPPVGDIGDPAWRTWSSNVWESTIGSDTASHFDRQTLDNFSGVYEFVNLVNVYSEQEVDAWRRLYAIVGPGRPIDRQEIVTLRDALSQARLANRMITGSALRMAQIAKAFDLPVNQDTVAQYASAPVDRYCGPIRRPEGEGYGQATMGSAVARIRQNPITRDEIGNTNK